MSGERPASAGAVSVGGISSEDETKSVSHTKGGDIPDEPVPPLIAEPFKQMVLDLQRSWLDCYDKDREELLISRTQKIHKRYLDQRETFFGQLSVRYKAKLCATKTQIRTEFQVLLRAELEAQYASNLNSVSAAKRKHWCHLCERPAKSEYFCCFFAKYCSELCQKNHWDEHSKVCRRKMDIQQALANAANAAMQK